MAKTVIKTIIKHLADAPAIAARDVLEQLPTEEERAEARRIFAAVGITPKAPEKRTKGGAKQ